MRKIAFLLLTIIFSFGVFTSYANAELRDSGKHILKAESKMTTYVVKSIIDPSYHPVNPRMIPYGPRVIKWKCIPKFIDEEVQVTPAVIIKLQSNNEKKGNKAKWSYTGTQQTFVEDTILGNSYRYFKYEMPGGGILDSVQYRLVIENPTCHDMEIDLEILKRFK